MHVRKEINPVNKGSLRTLNLKTNCGVDWTNPRQIQPQHQEQIIQNFLRDIGRLRFKLQERNCNRIGILL